MAEVVRLQDLLDPVPMVAGAVFLGVLWGITLGESPSLTIFAGIVTVLAVKLLWQPGQPPTLLLLAALHLLQVETALVYANVIGVHINSLSEFGVDLENATLVALGAVLCLIVGMSLGNAGPAIWSPSVAQKEAGNWLPRQAFRFYVVTLGIELFCTAFSTLSEGVRQFFLAGASIEWIGIFLLAYVCLSQKRGFSYLLVAVAIEVVLGFTGFFGGFKTVFLVLFIAFASAKPKLNFGSVAAIIVTVAISLLLTAFWSDIKADYRAFLNKGSEDQVALVPMEERFAYLSDRINEADGDTLASGFDKFLKRMSYVEFFAATMHFVPESRPHENGAMTMTAISHILLPRMLFPDKAPLPLDTTVTVAYTGLPIELHAGTSISIGYAGEFYIDFGVSACWHVWVFSDFYMGKQIDTFNSSFPPRLLLTGQRLHFFYPVFSSKRRCQKFLELSSPHL